MPNHAWWHKSKSSIDRRYNPSWHFPYLGHIFCQGHIPVNFSMLFILNIFIPRHGKFNYNRFIFLIIKKYHIWSNVNHLVYSTILSHQILFFRSFLDLAAGGASSYYLSSHLIPCPLPRSQYTHNITLLCFRLSNSFANTSQPATKCAIVPFVYYNSG